MTPVDTPTILVAEDEPDVRGHLKSMLQAEGYGIAEAGDGDECIQVLRGRDGGVDLVLLDLQMPRQDGLTTLREIRKLDRELPVVVLSGTTSTTRAAQAIQFGAADFLAKPVREAALRESISKNLGRSQGVPARNSGLANAAPAVFQDAWMARMETYLLRAATSDVPILIQGETGVGKEVIASFLHRNSPRANRPFIKLNCAALPSELIESELFGYEKGAFTGAFKSKPGRFDAAAGGTLLLDEIGDMDIRLQAKLLQVLQDQEFQRLGGVETVRADVRVMAATHRDLEQAIDEGRFREDLYHRLNVLNVFVPALRERSGMIVPLAEFFLLKHTGTHEEVPVVTSEMQAELISYPWPGNIRELENFMRRYAAFPCPEMALEELERRARRRRPTAPKPVAEAPGSPATIADLNLRQRQMEADTMLSALEAARWNRKQAASMLNMEYKAFLYKMKKLGLDRNAQTAP
ncbi:MAG: sigma-54-dependent Fis family transcriptional regulator [Bryobacterales bacterium]|nr:sigma-54-dependent Fis family transcriptional regulator [Bryobacterales bacterium]